MRNNCHI